MEFWVDMLEKYRVELTNNLYPGKYFDKFRSEGIFDEGDTQQISSEALHPTRAQKAGQFLDILRTRGSLAYKLLLECLESDHPEIYQKMTGREADPKPWTYGLQRRCSCDCHDDRIPLDMMERYREERTLTLSLKQENGKLLKTLERVRVDRNKYKEEAETQAQQLDMFKTEREQVKKLQEDILWKRDQIANLQGKAFDLQNQLMAKSDQLSRVNLENNTLNKKVREMQARLAFQRKKSTRLEKEKSESDEKMKAGDAMRNLVEQLQLELEKKKIEEARKTTEASNTTNELHEQTRIEIMIADKEEAVVKCEEAVRELHQVRNRLYVVNDGNQKIQAENEELETKQILMNEQLDMVTERLQMAQDELVIISRERTQVYEERNRAIEETARSLVERDDIVKKLNNERLTSVSQSRQLFEYKTKIQRMKREKQAFAPEPMRPSSFLSSEGSSGEESKRNSAARSDVMSPGDVCEAQPSYPVGATMSNGSAKHADAKRSLPLRQMKSKSIEEEEDDDPLDDYDFPSTMQQMRKRSQPLIDLPKMKAAARRGSNASRQMDADIPEGTGEDAVDGDNSPDQEIDPRPRSGDFMRYDQWPGFPVSGSDEVNGQPKRRNYKMVSTDSMEVQPGSLKDKKRAPAPRISSYDIPGPNYMAELSHDRRSKTLGAEPDDISSFNSEGSD